LQPVFVKLRIEMLKDLINQFFLDKERDREQQHFYITDAGKCERAIFFKFKNVPREKMSADVLRMLDHGDYVQMHILNCLFSLGIVRSSEIKIPPQEIISGRADAIVTLNNELYVVDFKSMNSYKFKMLEEAPKDNINQIQLYMHYFKISKGILLYVNKDTLALKEFLINYDPILAKSLMTSLESLKGKIDTNVVPARLLDYPGNVQCRYCAFSEICKIAGGVEVGWENFKEKIESA
jgi:CRISPR/Cas system-associated exonuclease Cas4 (RecB family)